MASLTIACPSCGTTQKLPPESIGQKVQCFCGMHYSASPIFAVNSERNWLRARGKQLLTAVALIGGCAGVAAWFATRPNAAESPDGPVAAAPAEPKDKAPAVDAPFDDPPLEAKTEPKSEPKAVAPTTPLPPAKVAIDPKPTPPPAVAKLPPPAAKPKPIKVETLFDAFDLDAAKAKAQYVNQPLSLVVRGKVAHDAEGKAYFGGVVGKPSGMSAADLAKLTPRERNWETNGYPPSVLCYLAADQTAAFEGLPAERDVTLTGVCRGRRDDAGAFMGFVVVLRDCIVAK